MALLRIALFTSNDRYSPIIPNRSRNENRVVGEKVFSSSAATSESASRRDNQLFTTKSTAMSTNTTAAHAHENP